MYQPAHTLLRMYERAISNVSGEEVSGMTITTRNQGAMPCAVRTRAAHAQPPLQRGAWPGYGVCRSMAAG
jgi:hypothetical protein